MFKRQKSELPLTDMQKALLGVGLIKQKRADKYNLKEQKRIEKMRKQNEK